MALEITTAICLNPKIDLYQSGAANRSIESTMLAIRTFVRRLSTEKYLNRVSLIGRVGSDAQLKGTIEHPVVIFNVATHSGPKTEWHKISVFKTGLRQIAENYVKSGARVFVEGKLSHGHIIDQKGNAIPTTSIIADDIIFLSKSADARASDLPDVDETAQAIP